MMTCYHFPQSAQKQNKNFHYLSLSPAEFHPQPLPKLLNKEFQHANFPLFFPSSEALKKS